MFKFGRVGIGALLCAGLLFVAGQVEAAKRVALVIGNNDYSHLPNLNNAQKDAQDMASKLKGLGFEIILKLNAGRRDLIRAKRQFEGKLSSSETGLIFYAGHGIQADGKNYLIPSDANIEFEDDLESEGVEAKSFLESMERAGAAMNIVILDACRDNPLPTRTRSAARGLAVVGIPKNAKGTAVLYSAGEGQTAQDGPRGGNGVFTGELLKVLGRPGLTLEQTFKLVAKGVNTKTNGKQRPWSLTSLQGDFYFKAGQAPANAARPVVPSGGGANMEAMFWQSISNSKNATDYQAYLDQFPNGTFSGLASSRVDQFKKPVAPSFEVASLDRTMWVSKKNTVNVRSGPGTKFDKVGKLKGHGEVLITGSVKGSAWVRVALASGDEGYVLGALLSKSKPQVQVAMSERVEKPKSKGRSVGSVFKDCPDCAEMVVMPTGSFRMGDVSGGGGKNEKPVHTVNVNYSFAVGKYEVTQAQWQAVMGKNPSNFKGRNRPVEQVSFDDIQDYLDRLNRQLGLSGNKAYRLLSEAEWEYAARAGMNSKYSCGIGDGCLDGAAWYEANSGNQTHPVGQKQANPWGLYDMHGNVWEWVGDCWNGSYSNAPSNGSVNTSGDCRERVLRGGSWNNGPSDLRSAARDRYIDAVKRGNLSGFRIARTL